MRQSTLARFLLIGLVISLALGWVSFIALRALNESSIAEMRRHMILFIAQRVESGPYSETVRERPFRAFPRKNQAFRPRRRLPHQRRVITDLWVLSPQGEILASNVNRPLPISWNDLRKPKEIHDFTFHYPAFRLVPDLTLVKLDAPRDTYLLIAPRHPPRARQAFLLQIGFFFFIVGIAVIISLAMIYYYLRQKSVEARTILSRLENGDLKARFEITRLDEIGSLMLDFNRMASEIERLVHRVQETERARKHLLSELSHDIRTPLTSLKTSIETLAEHLDEMPRETQKEFLSVSQGELSYFLSLIDDLFFIADLGEPRYKKSTERVDLAALIRDEIRARHAHDKASDTQIQWNFETDSVDPARFVIPGDSLLLQRLVRNALENASKNAETRISIHLHSEKEGVLVEVNDDGPGISDEAIQAFGERKTQRFTTPDDSHRASLGLGSVIMKTIAELHGGKLRIGRLPGATPGTRLSISLPG